MTIVEIHKDIQSAMSDARKTPEYAIEGLELELARTKHVLGTLISWIGQSNAGIIRIRDAEALLKELESTVSVE